MRVRLLLEAQASNVTLASLINKKHRAKAINSFLEVNNIDKSELLRTAMVVF